MKDKDVIEKTLTNIPLLTAAKIFVAALLSAEDAEGRRCECAEMSFVLFGEEWEIITRRKPTDGQEGREDEAETNE